MMEKLKAMKFDLFITEYTDCALVLKEKLEIKKHIGIFSTPMPYFGNLILGLPSSWSFVPGESF
jgi:hypothetical protein